MKIISLSIVFLFSASVLMLACSKDKSAGDSTLQIRMTDAPAAWEEVNVDLVQVNVKMANDSTDWISLSTNAGVYNLLELQNGVDTLIAQGVVPDGVVKEIRLVLGNDNTIKANGQVFPLTIPSGSTSGLKIKVNKSLDASIETLLIDFDAALSVKQEAGGFMLRPVIKLK